MTFALSFLTTGLIAVVSILFFAAFPKRRHLLIFAAMAVLALHCALYWRFTVDDSLISYRFARNWADGLGPVYQTGDRVEGYTSFLWIVLLAAARRFGVDIEFSSKVLGLIAGFVTVFFSALIAKQLTNGRPSYLIAPFALALSPLFAAWTCSGMDAVLFAAVLVMAAYAIKIDESGRFPLPLSAALFGVAALTRPEGALFAAVAFITIVTTRAKSSRTLGWFRWGFTFAAVVAPYFAWRFSYYGALLPNTFYAKTGRGLERLASGVWSEANFVESQGLLFLVLCLIAIPHVRWRNPLWRFTLMSLGAFFAYVIWCGGDFLHLRFYVHVMGLLSVCAAVGFDAIASKWQPERGYRYTGGLIKQTAMWCIVAISWVGLTYAQDLRTLRSRDQFGANYVVNNATNISLANNQLGKWLHAHTPPGSKVATWDIGGLGYYSDLYIIDMYGLVDRQMARLIHNHASDSEKAAYVRSRNPEFIVAYARPGRPDPQWLTAAKNWVQNNYRYHSYWKGGPDGYGVALLVRKDIRLSAANH